MFGSLPLEFGGDGRGGVAVHTGKIAEALSEAGESVTVFATDVATKPQAGLEPPPFSVMSYSPPDKKAVITGLAKSWRTTRRGRASLMAAMPWRESLWVRGAAQTYLGLLRDHSPDVVHVHGAGLTVLAVHRALSRFSAPLVATVHSLRGHVPDSAFFARSVPSLMVPDALITVSRHLKAEAAAYGAEEARIHVIPNGVDTGVFRPLPQHEARRKLDLPGDSPIVLLVAHLIERKGADVAIQAMRRVVSHDPTATLYLIGSAQAYTDPAWKRRVLDLPARLGIEGNVFFLGDVPGHADGRLNLWYNAADLLVLPSRAEGMGMVLTEAMACGTPPIGTRVGGIPDVITHRGNGLLVPPEDPEALASAIIDILNDRDLRARLGEAGVDYVSREHDWSIIAARTREVYSEALERSGTR